MLVTRVGTICLLLVCLAQPVQARGIETHDLSILSLNLAGLPWPLATRREEAILEIGRQIAQLSQAGPEIDVILLQEGFTDIAATLQETLGITEYVAGPDKPRERRASLFQTGDLKRKWWKGEGIGPWVGSGLHVYSVHPIVGVKRHAFGEHACAGYDCLANKGVILTRILVPGLPTPIDVITTHLNSTRSARVPLNETQQAHQRQTLQLAEFWHASTAPEIPAILAGDLNVRRSHERFIPLAKQFKDATFVKNDCALDYVHLACQLDLHSDAPWLSSQDIQAYRSGSKVHVSVLEARTVLTESINGKKLSDHDGYLVRYRLTWVSDQHDHTVALQVDGD